MKLFDELKARGMIAQCTNEEKVRNLLNDSKIKFYIGFDPTADSLHIGHFVQVMVMSHMQRAGHTPIALFGGGTAMIGDPTGKTDMRKMLTHDEIEHNIACFKKQMAALVDFSDGKAIMVNNADWLLNLNYIDFLRDIGVHFSVNRMLSFECYKQRMERGLTFFELNYMLMQSYDFLYLAKTQDCLVELGGDDQWSNIIGGVELVRKTEGREVYGLTFALLLTGEGKKMGKTESGAIWLDPEKTSPYDFFQYWRNIDDGDVIKCMKMLTFMPLDEIALYEKMEGSELNKAKEKLAYEVTSLIHGKSNADNALSAAKALFGAGEQSDSMPSTEINSSNFENGSLAVTDMLVLTGLASSKGEAKRLIMQCGVSIDDVKITDAFLEYDEQQFDKGYVVIKKGKKAFHKLIKN